MPRKTLQIQMNVVHLYDRTDNKEKNVLSSDKNVDGASGTTVHKVKLSLCLN